MCSNLRSGILVRLGQVTEIMGFEELLEGHWFDMRVFGVIQVFLQVGLAVCAVILVKPSELGSAFHNMTH